MYLGFCVHVFYIYAVGEWLDCVVLLYFCIYVNVCMWKANNNLSDFPFYKEIIYSKSFVYTNMIFLCLLNLLAPLEEVGIIIIFIFNYNIIIIFILV